MPNEEIAEVAAANPDVLIPFASVDPNKGARAVEEARRLIRDHGVRGFKFHPNVQAFYPNDRAFYPLYEVVAEAGLPALFHTGHSGIGVGLPGGGGIRLKYSNPMYVDDVAVDFPELTIVLAHPSFPWQDEAISVALHKEQVFIDLSGWSPKYFPPQLVHYANTLLRDRVLFGSDYPLITPDRWLDDFARADFKDEVRPLILKENAARLLGLTDVALRPRARPLHDTRRRVPDRRQQPAREEEHDRHQDQPEDAEREDRRSCVGEVPAEEVRLRAQLAKLLLEVEDGDGARDGAVDVAEAADGHHDDELDAEHDREGLGRDDEEREREETAAETGERRGEDEQPELVARDGNARRGCGRLVRRDRLERSAHPRADEVRREQQGDRDDRPDDGRVQGPR